MRNNFVFIKVNVSCEFFLFVLIDLILFDLVFKFDDFREIWRDDILLVFRFFDICNKRIRYWIGWFGLFSMII